MREVNVFGSCSPASTSMFICGMCWKSCAAPFNMPKPAAYADVFAHTLSLCFITVFHSSRLADLQGLEICRLWVLFHCFEMHVYTCIYLAHCMHFAVINLFFFWPLRYCQFFGQDEFCHYNMFNHHFFDDEVKTNLLWRQMWSLLYVLKNHDMLLCRKRSRFFKAFCMRREEPR